MKGLFILLLVQISVQLQCDKTVIQATIGSTFTIVCNYKTNQYRFNKKYWCAGEPRSSCEVLMDTDRVSLSNYRKRAEIIDAISKGLIVHVKDLQLDDTGIYWVGIDKIYADLMFRIQVTVRNEAVMKPNVWPVGSLEMTCFGQPVTFRCKSKRGTDVQYTWYIVGHPSNIVLHHSTDIDIRCSNNTENRQFFCSASNDVSSQSSESLTVQGLQPANQDCIYLITSKSLASYECIRSTTSSSTTIQTTENLWSSASYPTGVQDQTVYVNQMWMKSGFPWSGLPLWYECLRWLLTLVMIIIVCIMHMCTKSRSKTLKIQDIHHKDV